MFQAFTYIPNYSYQRGWDRYALDYEKLLVKDTVYYLTKEMMHHIVDSEINQHKKDIHVLDVNCGTGNDFPFFFKKGWKVVGCDGSKGMLNRASINYASQMETGQIRLFSGLLEDLDIDSFEADSFDLIFSVTGGFSYVNDQELRQINQKLKRFLKPGGKIILAHLNPLCLPEMIYRALQLKNPFFRIKQQLKVNIKNEDHIMYLRGVQRLKKLYAPFFSNTKFYPLLALTPPYQTQFKPGKRWLSIFRQAEKKVLHSGMMANIADQVVITGQK